MLRLKYLFKLLPATRTQSLQFNITQRPGKFYSTSFTRLDEPRTNKKHEKIENEQLYIGSVRNVNNNMKIMIEGPRIRNYFKKIEIGLTENEDTAKVFAKTKDFTAFIFAGGVAVALGYVLYCAYSRVFENKSTFELRSEI